MIYFIKGTLQSSHPKRLDFQERNCAMDSCYWPCIKWPPNSYHPQIEGQTKIVNKWLKGYLRNYVLAQQWAWVKWIHLGEYCYNTMYHMSIGMTPFKARRRLHRCNRLHDKGHKIMASVFLSPFPSMRTVSMAKVKDRPNRLLWNLSRFGVCQLHLLLILRPL